jgi:hypothetical protein
VAGDREVYRRVGATPVEIDPLHLSAAQDFYFASSSPPRLQ